MKTHGIELRPVELRDTQGQSSVVDEGGELPASLVAQPGEAGLGGREPAGRPKVWRDEHEATGESVGEAGHPGANGKMQNEDVLGTGDPLVVPEWVCLPSHRRVYRLGIDLRLVTAALQDPLSAKRLVADGVPMAQRGDHLVYLHRSDYPRNVCSTKLMNDFSSSRDASRSKTCFCLARTRSLRLSSWTSK